MAVSLFSGGMVGGRDGPLQTNPHTMEFRPAAAFMQRESGAAFAISVDLLELVPNE